MDDNPPRDIDQNSRSADKPTSHGISRFRETLCAACGCIRRWLRCSFIPERTLEESQKSRWKEHLNKVVHAYNSTVNEATGFSPFFLLFGREPTLPVDLMFPKRREERSQSHTGYAEKWREVMQEAYAIAMQNMKKSARRGQKNYNKRAWSSTLQPGDHFLVRNLTPRGGPGKLRSYWEDVIHVVRARKGPESPVYVVEPLQGTGRRQVLHRNLLLPCPYLVEEPEACGCDLKERNSGNKQRPITRRRIKPHTHQRDTDSSSDDECEMWTAVRYANPTLNAGAEEFCPRTETHKERPEPELIPEEHPEEEQVDDGHSVEEEAESPAVEPESEQSDAETCRDRPKRIRQPRRVYTYEKLGQPTIQQLKTCSVNLDSPSEANYVCSARPSFLYPFQYE